jgi:hypothetical protein
VKPKLVPINARILANTVHMRRCFELGIALDEREEPECIGAGIKLAWADDWEDWYQGHARTADIGG